MPTVNRLDDDEKSRLLLTVGPHGVNVIGLALRICVQFLEERRIIALRTIAGRVAAKQLQAAKRRLLAGDRRRRRRRSHRRLLPGRRSYSRDIGRRARCTKPAPFVQAGKCRDRNSALSCKRRRRAAKLNRHRRRCRHSHAQKCVDVFADRRAERTIAIGGDDLAAF